MKSKFLNKTAEEDRTIFKGKAPYEELQERKSITPADAAWLMKRTLAAKAAKEAMREALRLIGPSKENNDVLERAVRVLDQYILDRASFPPVKEDEPFFL